MPGVNLHSIIPPDGILNQTIAGVTDILGGELGGILVERAVVGLYFTGVKLAAERHGLPTAGTCATPHDAAPGDICCSISAHRVAFRRLAVYRRPAIRADARCARRERPPRAGSASPP